MAKRVVLLAVDFMLALGLVVGIARGEQPDSLTLQQPSAVQQTAFEYDRYLSFAQDDTATPLPENAPAAETGQPAEAVEQAIDQTDCAPGCAIGCCDGCAAPCGGCGQCGLPQPCALQCLGITVGGWLEQGVTFNADGRGDGFNGPIFTNDWTNEYQLNQLWLFLDRPANNGGYGLAVGGHIDVCYGTDWRYGIQYGLEDDFQNVADRYGLVFPQIYLEVAYNNLSVKVGHFAGLLSYEVVPAPLNPFYSHAYEYAAVPELVTGATADYKLSSQWSVQAGFHRGWMMWEDNNDRLDFMGGVKWVSWNKRTSLAYALSTGPYDNNGDNNRFVYSLVFQQQLSQRLKYVAVHDLGYAENGGIGGRDEEWYGLNQYFLYKLNPCWDLNMRFEWFRDDDGGIVRGLGTVGRYGWPGSGFAGNFYELTLGATWKPMPNVMLRPECRWDWYNGDDGTGVYALPFDGGTKDNQFTFAMDLIVSY